MNKLLFALAVFIISTSTCFADSTLEKEFVDRYKKAFETKDGTTLESFLYTKGSDPMALEFYKMMMTSEMGSKISSIELLKLTPDEAKKASGTMPSPDGGQSKLPVAPNRKLIIKIENTDANGTSKSSSESFVAEVDGKLMIPVPAPVTK